MRNLTLLAARTVLGGYLAVHGSQKLFGSFGGPGLDNAGAGFASMGLTPGKPMAVLAGASELGGGLLTIAGLADPVGPVALAGTMAVAGVVHRRSGPMAANGGFELPAVNLALAAVLAAAGPGTLSLGRRLPTGLNRLVVLGATALTGLSLAKVLAAAPPTPAPLPAADALTPEPVPATTV